MELLKYQEFINENEEKRKSYIKKYCEEIAPVPQESKTFKEIYDELDKIGKYKNTIKSINAGDAAIVGIRRKLQERKKNPEKYIDTIYFIPKNSNQNNPTITSFQATTVPSVAWFDHDVAILDDGEYRFKIGTHTFSSLNKTIPALVPDIPGLPPKSINVNRFSKEDDEVNTYDPPKKDIGKSTNFHYGLTPKNVKQSKNIPCVGGYSAGCQVIPTEEKWKEFWDLIKNSGQKVFWYSIIEEDKIK